MSASAIARLAGAGVTMLAVVILARRLGPSESGLFLFGWLSVQYVAAFCRLGSQVPLLRVASQAFERGDFRLVRGVTLQAVTVSFACATVVAVFLGLLSGPIATLVTDLAVARHVVVLFASAIPSVALSYVVVEVLKACRRVELGSFIQSGLVASFLIPLVIWRAPNDVQAVAVLFGISCASAMIVAGAFTVHATGVSGGATFAPWRGFARSASIVSMFDAVWIAAQWLPIVVISAVVDERALGLLLTANRFASMGSVFVVALTNVVGPEFARLAMAHDLRRISDILQRVASCVVLVGLVVVPVLIVFGSQVMSVAGGQFRSGDTLLVLFAISQLIRAATAAAGHALAMLGFERSLLANGVWSLAVGLVSVTVLTPMLGAVGGAVAIGASVTTQGLLDVRAVRVHTGFGSAPGRRVSVERSTG